jgi:hypothetical protein
MPSFQVKLYEGTLGLAHEKTLRKCFRLLNLYIQHYKLDVMDELLAKVAETCTQCGKGSVWYIKYIQMLGFCRWKQYKLREALALFLEQAPFRLNLFAPDSSHRIPTIA